MFYIYYLFYFLFLLVVNDYYHLFVRDDTDGIENLNFSSFVRGMTDSTLLLQSNFTVQGSNTYISIFMFPVTLGTLITSVSS